MTGYGRSEHEARDVGVEAEIRSVNGRHLSVRSRLPSDWMRFEPHVERLVRSVVRAFDQAAARSPKWGDASEIARAPARIY